jgi:hypothetical protein
LESVGASHASAVRATEAGASEHELMAMFGWDDANMSRVYTRKAAGTAKAGNSRLMPPIVPPGEKTRKNDALEKLFVIGRRWWKPRRFLGQSGARRRHPLAFVAG